MFRCCRPWQHLNSACFDMTYRAIFDAKIQGTSAKVTFDFASQLAAGETISSASVTAAVHSGTDATPSTLISGSASISGSKVTQTIANGVVGVTYKLICVGATSASRSIIQTGFLVITTAAGSGQ